MALIEITVPDIGDFSDVAVIEVMVKEGETLHVDQSIITVESDKASMEIPSSHAGIVKKILVKLGDKVGKGSALLMLDVQGDSAPACGHVSTEPEPPKIAQSAPTEEAKITSPISAPESSMTKAVEVAEHNPTSIHLTGLPYASPSVRKFARELGVPLNEIKGTAAKGRITPDDVKAFNKAVMTGDIQTVAIKEKAIRIDDAANTGTGLGLIPWPVVDFEKFGAVTRIDRSRIKKISAANLHRNWVMIPHVTNHDDADITDLEAFRLQLNKENEKSGVKITMLAFLLKACVAALKKYPDFNSSLDGDQLVIKQYCHIGFAADTPNGLMVPVIKDADTKGIFQLTQELGDLAKKARDGKLSPTEMQGASFTISSLGGIGGRYFTPIINAPEVAILGVCRSQMEPIWNGKEFAPRLRLPLSLSWDHRVIDGAQAARFNAYLSQILSDFRRVLL